MEHVVDEDVYKELDDKLARAATTASSLEAERDSGNINKTQSKATPNESSSQGTDSGGGPRCQDTMGDTIAQTRYERVFRLSNDSLLARHNTLQSDEDRPKLNELIELCTTLQSRVLNLEKRKTTQALEIDSLRRSKDQELISSKDYTRHHLMNDQDDEQIFDVNDLHGEEVFVQEDVASEVNTASIETTDSAAAIMNVDEVTLAQALMEIKSTKLKAKGIVLQEPSKSRTTTISLKKSQDKEQRLASKKVQQEEEANIALIETWNDVQTKINANYQLAERLTEVVEQSSKKAKAEEKIDDDKETVELKQLVKIIPDEEGVAIDAIPLAFKPPSIVDWKIQKEKKKSYYKIIKADGSSKIYLVFSHMLKSFDREDVETLWKLVKAKHRSTRPEGDYERFLWGDLKVMFEQHIKDKVWKMQQRHDFVRWALFNSYGVLESAIWTYLHVG
nr:hypothetical protein [Tanacetum cinerariifolium]